MFYFCSCSVAESVMIIIDVVCFYSFFQPKKFMGLIHAYIHTYNRLVVQSTNQPLCNKKCTAMKG